LPGTFLRDRETLAEAVQRSLDTKLGIRGIRPIQLFVFDDPSRDERHWVLSVAHVAVVRLEQLKSLGSGSAKEARLVPVDRPGELAWDHPNIVKRAKEYVRSRYNSMPDPDHLLDTNFTLRQLQEVHEAVAGRRLDRDRFRRKMGHHIVETGELSYSGSRGRPAEVFRRKTARDKSL
jgi:ADP-ribose pyrophosphatase YjhB (NUDIX family)